MADYSRLFFFTAICIFLALVMIKIRVRAVIGVMIFLGYFILYIIRYNLSVHVVDMAQLSRREVVNYSFSVSRRSDIENNMADRIMRGRSGIVDLINWDDLVMGRLLAAYHIGFCICFPIFHSIGDSVGPTWVVGIAGITSGVLSCLTPPSAYVNFWAFFVVRIITGFCAGAMQPSMVQVLRYWAPPTERNYFMWAFCGLTLGTCCTFLICAVVQYYSRWPLGFYIAGGLQIIWSIIWVFIVSDSPRKHLFISNEEQTYLVNTIGTIFTIKLTNSEAPWKLILTSVPFWAVCILNFGYSWMIISLCIHGPLYYCKILFYSIYDASALTALAFFLRLLLGTIAIQLFHWYKHKSEWRIKHIRKYFVVVSHVIPGMLVAFSWFTPTVPGPILLTLAVALTAAGMDMTLDLCNELTPLFANSVITVIKIIGNTAGIFVSLGVGHVTSTYKNSPMVWKHIWCFHATILFLSGIIFLICGETEVQPWNSRRVRPRRHLQFQPRRGSMMSDILEEDSGTLRLSQTGTAAWTAAQQQ